MKTNEVKYETPVPTAAVEFSARLVEEYSSTPRVADLGGFKHRMELYADGYKPTGLGPVIIWNYGRKEPVDDETVIGLELEGMKVTGYDGLFSLPREAVLLLKLAGYDTSEVDDSSELEDDKAGVARFTKIIEEGGVS